jgi:hypothetical protein
VCGFGSGLAGRRYYGSHDGALVSWSSIICDDAVCRDPASRYKVRARVLVQARLRSNLKGHGKYWYVPGTAIRKHVQLRTLRSLTESWICHENPSFNWPHLWSGLMDDMLMLSLLSISIQIQALPPSGVLT